MKTGKKAVIVIVVLVVSWLGIGALWEFVIDPVFVSTTKEYNTKEVCMAIDLWHSSCGRNNYSIDKCYAGYCETGTGLPCHKNITKHTKSTIENCTEAIRAMPCESRVAAPPCDYVEVW